MALLVAFGSLTGLKAMEEEEFPSHIVAVSHSCVDGTEYYSAQHKNGNKRFASYSSKGPMKNQYIASQVGQIDGKYVSRELKQSKQVFDRLKFLYELQQKQKAQEK